MKAKYNRNSISASSESNQSSPARTSTNSAVSARTTAGTLKIGSEDRVTLAPVTLRMIRSDAAFASAVSTMAKSRKGQRAIAASLTHGARSNRPSAQGSQVAARADA